MLESILNILGLKKNRVSKSNILQFYAGISYAGDAGITRTCIQAIVKILHFGNTIEEAQLLTHSQDHCFLLTVNTDRYVAVKSGFSSGYSGEGPRGLATALLLLERHNANINEYLVSSEIIDKIDQSCLTFEDIEMLENLPPKNPSRWYDYTFALDYKRRDDTRWLNEWFPLTIPLGAIDLRLTDLAFKFSEDPDMALMSGYRRLEDLLRERTGLSKESSSKLISKAFHADLNKTILTWENINPGEHAGRSQLFNGAYLAFRNRRAHRELNHPTRDSRKDVLNEFMILNQLYLLEHQSIERVDE